MESQIRIRHVPQNTNPVPRPNTATRPQTAMISPFMDNDTYDVIYEDAITREYLCKKLNHQDLDGVTELTLIINSTFQSILDLGDLLKNLRRLTLSGSNISTIRDLGVSLFRLENLSLDDCFLTELDGISILPNLKYLSAQNNLLTDISALAMHDNLEEVNLTSNKLVDITICDTLSSCLKLTKLHLSKNPLQRAPNYRLVVASLVSHLEMLDGSDVDRCAKSKVSNSMILEAASAMQLESEEMDDERRLEMEMMMEFGDACVIKSTDFGSTPAEQQAHGNGHSARGGGASMLDTGSDLTHGSAVSLAGGMAMAMRQRRKPPTSPGVSKPRSAASNGDDSECGMGEGGDETSAIRALDAVLLQKNYANSSLPKSSAQRAAYFGEGDITELVLNGDIGEVKPIFPPVAASPSRAKTPSREKMKRSSLANSSFDPEERRPSTQSQSRLNSFGGMSVSTSDHHVDDKLAYSSRDSTPRNSRPSSSAGGKIPPRSPHIQRNASRPSTSYSSQADGEDSNMPCNILKGGKAPSAPFKIPSSISGSFDDDGDDNDGILKRNGGGSTQQLTNAILFGEVQPSLKLADKGKGSSIANPLSRTVDKKYSSIVHRNSVIRKSLLDEDSDSKLLSGDSNPMRESLLEDRENDDVEEIAVDHKTRLQQMMAQSAASISGGSSSCSSSGSAGSAYSDSSANSNSNRLWFKKDLQAAASSSSCSLDHSGLAMTTGRIPAAGSLLEVNETFGSPIGIAQMPKKSMLSDIAGRSLGFDLKGSLAAINQWVDEQDPDSESDSSDADDDEGAVRPMWRGGASSIASARTRRVSVTDKPTAAGQGGGSNRILSRDTILSMCTAAGDEYDVAASSENSINGNGSSSHQERGGAPFDIGGGESEDDVEENEVSFYNNCNKIAAPSRHGSSSPSPSASLSMPPPVGLPTKKVTRPIPVVKGKSTGPSSKSSAQKTVKKEKDSDVRNYARNDSADDDDREDSLSGREGGGNASVSVPSHNQEGKSNTKSSRPVAKNASESDMAVNMSDDELIALLLLPPKSVPAMKTKSGYQQFFRGMGRNRMRSLLGEAYSSLGSADAREKLQKRMDLLSDVLVAD